MKVKIISDGSPDGTHVVNAETGEEIEGAYAVQWSCSSVKAQPARAIVYVAAVAVEATLDAKVEQTGREAVSESPDESEGDQQAQ